MSTGQSRSTFQLNKQLMPISNRIRHKLWISKINLGTKGIQFHYFLKGILNPRLHQIPERENKIPQIPPETNQIERLKRRRNRIKIKPLENQHKVRISTSSYENCSRRRSKRRGNHRSTRSCSSRIARGYPDEAPTHLPLPASPSSKTISRGNEVNVAASTLFSRPKDSLVNLFPVSRSPS